VIKSIFVGGTGSFQSFPLDPLRHEQTLKNLIFPSSQNDCTANIKVSCASCILDLEPNGFVCISSSNRADIEKAKNMAQASKEIAIKSGASLHSDHAHCICIFQQDLLRKSANLLTSKRKSKEKPTRILFELVQDLLSQCVVLEEDDTITIGHHLCKILDILKEKRHEEYKYLFTMVTKTIKGKRTIYDIDLPGGKRHLGETSFDCALRETSEETSLVMDQSWLIGNGEPMRSKSAYESGNVFYLARPPKEGDTNNLHLEDILSDVFWSNTGLGKK